MKILQVPTVGLTRLRWNPPTLWFLTRSMSTHYDVLGVKRNATEEDIKSAYVKLCKKYHPDVSSHQDSAKKFNEIAEAYAVLGNKTSKITYDKIFNPPSYSDPTHQHTRYREQHVHVHRQGAGFTRPQNYPEAQFTNVTFSSNRSAKENVHRGTSGWMAVTGALSLGIVTFVFILRKSFTVDRKVREEHANEIHKLVTRRGINPSEGNKLDKTLTAEKFRHVKF